MGTDPAVPMLAKIAVVAKHLKVGREVVVDDPCIEIHGPAHPSYCLAKLATIIVDMIDVEHARRGLSTATTRPTVVVEDALFDPIIPIALSFAVPIPVQRAMAL
jgi:hypothetical protein